MCGFAGVVHWDGSNLEQGLLERMARLLNHRGPDELCIAVPATGVGLAHARLRVIDLSEAARQPMSNLNQAVWLCFNGEIYNFRQLREELQMLGFSFHSQSDTEVILHAYEAWGSEAIRRLDGMFAIALWDSRKQQLLLARDRTGKKPLYYWTDGRCVTFGSEIKALLAHVDVPRRVHEKVLGHLLAFGYPPASLSCYEQIRQLLPATFLVFQSGQIGPRATTYWHLPSCQEPSAVSFEKAAYELKAKLQAAVRRRLLADVPLGAFLSGGLDSSIVVGLMSQAIPHDRVKTFSIGFEGDALYNETHYARLVAKRYNTHHTEFVVQPPAWELVDRLVEHHDQPFGDSSAIPTFLLCELARSHVTVALNGDGGDELFAGYDRFWATLLAERIPLSVRRAGFTALRGFPPSVHVRSRAGKLRKFLSLARKPFLERFLAWSGYFSDPEQWLLLDSSRSNFQPTQTMGLKVSASADSKLSQLLQLNFREYLPNDLNVKMDRCSMAHGLETRSPFLDTSLVEWAFQLPDAFKLRAGCSKRILRFAFRDYLPPEIQHRPKMGFGVPLGAWFRGRWKEPMRNLLVGSSPRIHRYVHGDRVQALVQSHLEGRQDQGQLLWLLLTLEVWLRQLEHPVPVPSPSRPVLDRTPAGQIRKK